MEAKEVIDCCARLPCRLRAPPPPLKWEETWHATVVPSSSVTMISSAITTRNNRQWLQQREGERRRWSRR